MLVARRDRPFCLYVSQLAIHNPVQVRGDPVRRTEAKGWRRWKPANEAERIEKFQGITLPIDKGVGQIRQLLLNLGLDRRTLVLFFSDNGAPRDFPSGSPQLRGRKGFVYEGGHKVPCIAWWPGKVDAGSTNGTPAITLDVVPTLLALAGVFPPRQRSLDAIDLSPVLLHGKEPPPRLLFWASLSNSGSRSEAMRDGPWKLVVRHPGARPGSLLNETVELYRLDTDPGEMTDLAGSEPQQTRSMRTWLKQWYADTRKNATPQPGGW